MAKSCKKILHLVTGCWRSIFYLETLSIWIIGQHKQGDKQFTLETLYKFNNQPLYTRPIGKSHTRPNLVNAVADWWYLILNSSCKIYKLFLNSKHKSKIQNIYQNLSNSGKTIFGHHLFHNVYVFVENLMLSAPSSRCLIIMNIFV